MVYRVYSAVWGYDEFNPGYGDARFSPIGHPATGARVPAMYIAEDEASALLETVFHDVTEKVDRRDRTVSERHLVGQMLAHMQVPQAFAVGDLRNPELARLGLGRHQVVSSSAEHYPCTRRLAVQAIARDHGGVQLDGLIWHSRQAELARRPDAEVMVIFGHTVAPARGSWTLEPPGIRNLYEAASGRQMIEEIADQLDATIEP